MSNSISSATLARYFGGTASPEESTSVEAWIGDDPARRAAIAEWRAAWIADVDHFAAVYDAEAAWTRLSGRIGLLTLVRDGRLAAPIRRQLPLAHSLARPRSRRIKALRWAAAAAVTVVAGTGVWRAMSWSESEHAVETVAMREHAIPRGQQGIVRLPDGSEVMLNAASRLRVPVTFGLPGQPRTLELEGQAYFTVVHDETRPFTVRTARGIVRDIGTRFDIRAYADDAEEWVTVTEGEVAVRGNGAATETPLHQGQAATVAGSGRVTLTRVDVDRAVAWTRGQLQLDDVTLAEAARRLGRWYDLDVRIVGDDLAQRRVVGSYRNEPVAQVLDIIATAVGARYEQQGRSVVFFLRGDR